VPKKKKRKKKFSVMILTIQVWLDVLRRPATTVNWNILSIAKQELSIFGIKAGFPQ
jgi:hypothetical protein